MSKVDIKIFKIAETKLLKDNVKEWLQFIGASEYASKLDDHLSSISDAEALIGLAGKTCYLSFEPSMNPNVTKIRKDWHEYFSNILSSGHGSVLQHSNCSFAIENITRVATAELNRHSVGCSISERSLRYCRLDKGINYWEPNSIKHNENDNSNLALKKHFTRSLFEDVYSYITEKYGDLLKLWEDELNSKSFKTKKHLTSMFRRIVPLGVATAGVWTFNMRALQHIIAMRASEEAEEEICYIFSNIGKMMFEQYPLLFSHFTQTEEGYWIPKYRKV